MQDADVPVKFQTPFGSGASGGNIRAVPYTTADPNAASELLGFPPSTLTAISAGGVAPDGRDFNGLLNQATAWCRWFSAGGPVQWDSAFSALVGGYPSGAAVASAITPGLFWLSTTDNNVTNPDSGGTGWTQYNLPSYFGVGGNYRKLKSINDGVSPNTIRNITAQSMILEDVAGVVQVRLTNAAVSVNSGLVGAGGLDSGTLAANTPYYEWVIAKAGGANPTAVMSLSPTTPLLPAAYTMRARVSGAAITNPGKAFFPVTQNDDEARYVIGSTALIAALPQAVAGSTGSTWAAITNILRYVPVTATLVDLVGFPGTANASGTFGIAPNSQYGVPATGFANPPPLQFTGNFNSTLASCFGRIAMEPGGPYYFSNTANAGVYVYGWKDQL